MIDRVSVSQDEEGQWWLEFYADHIRFGVLLSDILAWQEEQTSIPNVDICPHCGKLDKVQCGCNEV